MILFVFILHPPSNIATSATHRVSAILINPTRYLFSFLKAHMHHSRRPKISLSCDRLRWCFWTSIFHPNGALFILLCHAASTCSHHLWAKVKEGKTSHTASCNDSSQFIEQSHSSAMAYQPIRLSALLLLWVHGFVHDVRPFMTLNLTSSPLLISSSAEVCDFLLVLLCKTKSTCSYISICLPDLNGYHDRLPQSSS